MLHNHKWDLHVLKRILTQSEIRQIPDPVVCHDEVCEAASGAHGTFNNVLLELCSSHCKYEILKLIVFRHQ